MSKHTPGPWHWKAYPNGQHGGGQWDHQGPDLLDSKGEKIAVAFGYDCSELEIDQADMDLIAAAPDLYEACIALLAEMQESEEFGEQYGNSPTEGMNSAYRAIGKAHGGEA